MNPDKKGKKNIEIVTGTGENLDISVVSTHVAACKPKINKSTDKEVVVPKVKKVK
ncbi:MAG: hypothetical protein HFJ24_06040 [Clostridia bacterium]|nr:hypothetical protein [Clostridia bacterium]